MPKQVAGRRVHRVEAGEETVAVVVVQPSVHEGGHEFRHSGLREAPGVSGRGDDHLGQGGHDARAGRE